MRANNSPELIYRESTPLKNSADVYDFSERQTESGRRRHIKALQQENALLTQMVSELGIEIVRVRKLLARTMTGDPAASQ
jgi:hypothetical protein